MRRRTTHRAIAWTAEAVVLAWLSAPAAVVPARAAEAVTVTFAGEIQGSPDSKGTPDSKGAPDSRITPELKGTLLRPALDGRLPVVVALHGCGGYLKRDGTLSGLSQDWADRWVAAGYVVLFPDSFGSRGLGSQCQVAARTVVPALRARDARAAATWIGGQPYADPTRIALVGWSNGGSTVLRAVRTGFKPPPFEFVTAIAFYPGCRPLLERGDWRTRIGLTILIGEADDWTPPEPCKALSALSSGARTVGYPEAYHGFDAPGVPVRERLGLAFTTRGDGRAHVGTNPAARAAAIEAVTAQLAAAFARR